MLKATKLRIYPTTGQVQSLAVQFGCARFTWNKALALKASAWKDRQENLARYDLQAMILQWKKLDHPWLKEAHSQVLQSVLLNLDTAYTNFFKKRARFPKFKHKHASRQSIQYPQGVKLADDGLIYLPKVGWIKTVVHREIIGNIKTVTVSRDSTGKYYAAVLHDDGLEATPPLMHISRVVGIDRGIKDIVVSSNGLYSGNPRFLVKAERNLKRKQRQLSRKKKGSANRAKARKQVALAHERVRNARNDFQHKLSKQLIDENQAVIVETLTVKNMVKNRKLAKHISDAGWGTLVAKLRYKALRQGKYVLALDRFFPSSKTCSDCGTRHEGLTLSDRYWICSTCGSTHDRDLNAAINIRNQGEIELKAAGLTVSAHRRYVSPKPIASAVAVEVGSSVL